VAATNHSSPPIPAVVFIAMLAVVDVLGFIFIRKAYANPVTTIVVLWLLSYGMTQLWTMLFFHFWAIRHQYPSFWAGDLIFLPLLTAAPLSILLSKLPKREAPYWFQSGVWNWVAIVIAVIVALGFHKTQMDAFPDAALNSPPKLWHDWVVYPLFAYFLVSAAPAIWYSKWGLKPLFHGNGSAGVLIVVLPIVGVGLWLYAGNVLDRDMDIHAYGPPTVDAVRGYDWHTGKVSGPLKLDQSQRDHGKVVWVLTGVWH
jgi:hypothetical protein